MVKKIGFLILSLALLITGAIAFRKLNYWERSVRIFNYLDPDQRYTGRGGGRDRGRGGFERGRNINRERNFDLAEEFRGRIEEREGFRPPGEGIIPDSIIQQNLRYDREQMGKSRFEPEGRNRDGRGRGGFSRGRQVRLHTVARFLAVFTLFTVVAIYVDKLNKIRKMKLKHQIIV